MGLSSEKIAEGTENIGIWLMKTFGKLKMPHKVVTILAVFIFIFIIDDIFSFSFNYRMNEKISQIEQIEEIRYKYPGIINDNSIENIRKQILTQEPTISFKNLKLVSLKGMEMSSDIGKGVTFKNLFTIETFYQIFYGLSIVFFWIITVFIGFFTLGSKDKKLSEGLIIIGAGIFMSIIWYYLFQFLNGFFGTKHWGFNVLYNIVILTIIGVYGNKAESNDKKTEE